MSANAQGFIEETIINNIAPALARIKSGNANVDQVRVCPSPFIMFRLTGTPAHRCLTRSRSACRR